MASATTSRSAYEILPTVIHEIGHTFDLGHASALAFHAMPLGALNEVGEHDDQERRGSGHFGATCRKTMLVAKWRGKTSFPLLMWRARISSRIAMRPCRGSGMNLGSGVML